ncbi:MAG: selenoneine synthase SenA [Alphaproteobacteria bacterium]|nr:selenoneine synthase SenA [Alphaproteobacteria bacterium]
MHRSVHSPQRHAGPAQLAQALTHLREQHLALIRAWRQALPDLAVPQESVLNPPIWEWGHVAWFQEWWTVRNAYRYGGRHSPSEGSGFGPSILAGADALYNSSNVAHDRRWVLPLPDGDATLAYLQQVNELSLSGLRTAPNDSDDSMYFWRLALFHEAMHVEASVYMAQHLGLSWPLSPERRESTDLQTKAAKATLRVEATSVLLGHRGPGFAFDNECQAHTLQVDAFEIDVRPVTWGAYLDFLTDTGHPLPQVLRQHEGAWEVRRFDRWLPLPVDEVAVHLSATDAQAWCEWAGRRLPTEAQWCAAAAHPEFIWGEVWEWTASPFEPFPGFVAHAYQDYSAPWWGTHRVLKGASWATPECLLDTRFRNFFMPHRTDMLVGFRTLAMR